MARIVTLKRQNGEITFPVTSTKAVLDSEGVSMEKIFSKKSETIEDVSFRYENGSVVLEAEFADGDTEIASIPEATDTANGLMSVDMHNRLMAVASFKNSQSAEGLTIPQLQSAIDSWLDDGDTSKVQRYKIPNATFNTAFSDTVIGLWNSGDTTTKITTGGRWTFSVIGTYSNSSYITLRIAKYFPDRAAVYYVTKYGGVWGKIYQAATTNQTVSDVNILSSPTDGVRIAVEMGDGTTKTPISIPEASYNYSNYSGANGLMSALDKEALFHSAMPTTVMLAGKTIQDLRNTLDAWLSRLASKGIRNATFLTNIGTAFIADWNSNNTTSTMVSYGYVQFSLISSFSDGSYATLMISQYSDVSKKMGVFYVSKYNNNWGQIYRAATSNNTVTGLNIADDSQTGDVYLELEMGDGVSKVAGYLPTASTSGNGLMDREDKAKLDSIDKIPNSFIEGLFSASVG